MLIKPSRRDVLRYAGAGAPIAALPAFARTPNAIGDPWDRAADIARTVQAPTFPARDFPVTAHGAKGDRTTLNTDAVAEAIAVCSAAGGGRVVVPAGRFLTGEVHLMSTVNLHVAEGATLLFSTDPAYYPLVFTRWSSRPLADRLKRIRRACPWADAPNTVTDSMRYIFNRAPNRIVRPKWLLS